jgi:lipopolysaccharide/colanic/teichoic acid biosynthesis glycosyltransferase
MLTSTQQFQKRLFDVFLSSVGILMCWWIILAAWLVSTVETKSNGFFVQKRIGRFGQPFNVFKIKTMKQIKGLDSTVTTANDSRITKSGKFFRKTKIDELPQLFNVLIGTMSFVGPRPDVPGFADKLEGVDRSVLEIRPGITGPASLKYKNEEEILASQDDPEKYNRDVIWPDKVRINKAYIDEWSLKKDIMCIIKTITG